MNTVQVLFHRY